MSNLFKNSQPPTKSKWPEAKHAYNLSHIYTEKLNIFLIYVLNKLFTNNKEGTNEFEYLTVRSSTN